jgi:hypothetical protein
MANNPIPSSITVVCTDAAFKIASTTDATAKAIATPAKTTLNLIIIFSSLGFTSKELD